MIHQKVPSEKSGITLLAFIKNLTGNHYSNRFLKRVIECNHCQVNGRIERHASTILGNGDEVIFTLPSIPSYESIKKDDILFEDHRLIIYNKPAGLSCDNQNLGKIIKKYCPTASLVHRLDRDTTGVIIIAKEEKTQQLLIDLFRKQEIQKTYFAIVDGQPKEDQGSIENYLGKIYSYQGQGLWGKVDQAKGLYARTSWKCINRQDLASLIQCTPHTGRTHQLRVHLSSIGHPILGDYQYCQAFRCPYRPQRYLLHALQISFNFPDQSSKIFVKAPLPTDFKEALKQLNLSVGFEF